MSIFNGTATDAWLNRQAGGVNGAGLAKGLAGAVIANIPGSISFESNDRIKRARSKKFRIK